MSRPKKLKFRKPRIKRYKLRRVGVLDKVAEFLRDFNQALLGEIKDTFKLKFGWMYVVTYDRGVVAYKWYWTYKGAMKAAKRDVELGYTHPEQFIRMQQGDKVASMIHDIRKEPN